jgi:hypothetical protein
MALFSKAEDLFSHIKEYVNNRVDSAKLNVADKTSRIVANGIAILVIVVLSLFFMVFASIAFAHVLGIWTGKLYWGFLIIAGIYLLLAFFIWLGKNKLIRLPIMNAILRQLFNDNDNEEH